MISLKLFYWIVVALVFGTFASFAWAIIVMPADDAPPLGLRGIARARGKEASGLWRAVEPFVRWMGTRILPLLPRKYADKLDQMIAAAGDPLGLMPAELLVLSGGLSIIGLSFGILYTSSGGHTPLLVPMAAGLLGSLPFVRISSVADARLLQIRRSLPTMVDLLCLSLSAGKDFPGAVRQVVDKSNRQNDPLREELSVVLRELQLGKTRREVLQLFAKRAPVHEVREFVASVIQAEEEGTPLGTVLEIQASVSRQHRSARAEELASRAGIQMVIPMGLAFLTILILIAGPLGLVVMKEFQ